MESLLSVLRPRKLIRHWLNESGAIETKNLMLYDTIIIGASAAGMSGAIYLKRRGVNFLLEAKDIGGEMALSGEIENYPGIPSTNGIDLTQKFKEHLKKYSVPIEEATEVKNIIQTEKLFAVETVKNGQNVTDEGKTIIIATGSTPRKLNIAGEVEFYHKGVSYCTVCDGPTLSGQPVAIIGGGNSALEAGLMMSALSPRVYILTKNNKMKGDTVLINELGKKENAEIIYNAQTREIFGQGFVKGLRYLDLKTNQAKELSVEGVFIHIGLQPNSDFIPAELNIKNQFGEVSVNKLCQTSVPGLLAAGDVTDIPYKQIGIAVGQGITAALSAISYLNSTPASI